MENFTTLVSLACLASFYYLKDCIRGKILDDQVSSWVAKLTWSLQLTTGTQSIGMYERLSGIAANSLDDFKTIGTQSVLFQ